jgi:hypothetical protein
MKALAFFAFMLATSAAKPVDGRVSYVGHKVFRVPVLDDGTHVQALIDRLNLNVWQPPSKKGAFADIQVAPGQLAAFKKAMQGHRYETMHEDLDESIASEGVFQAYACKTSAPLVACVTGREKAAADSPNEPNSGFSQCFLFQLVPFL